MTLLEEVLLKIKCPIIIWKRNDDNEILCYFTNKSDKVNINDNIKNYKENISYSEYYDNVFNENEITIKQNGFSIIIAKINDNSFYELHYPECTGINILQSISNKIRNPLQNILGVLIMLDDHNLSQQTMKLINVIKKSSFEIVSVVNDIIDILNLENKKVKLTQKNNSLKTIVSNVVNVISDDIKNKNLSFNLQYIGNIPQIIFVDKTRLSQILINILKNSIKFTNFGAINVEIMEYKKNSNIECPFPYVEPNDDQINILFKIKDTGIGMCDEQKKIIDNILEIDQFKNIKTYRNYGFGLLISNYLCKLMGGRIWYRTEVDIGTIFYFNIICKYMRID